MPKKKTYLKPPAVKTRPPAPPNKDFPLSTAAVVLGWLAWGGLSGLPGWGLLGHGDGLALAGAAAVFLLMLGCVAAVVRHADHLADSLPEPYGTLILTLSATVIEVSLMLRVMLQGAENPTLLRDTIFAVLMISMNMLVGLALVCGGWRHLEQSFNLRGAIAFVQLIAPLSLLLLVLPNHTELPAGPILASHHETYLGVLSLVVYLLFLVIQTGRHRSHFDHLDAVLEPANSPSAPKHGVSAQAMARSVSGLLLALLPVVLLAEHLGEAINYGIDELHAPVALGGLIIASIGLFPEGLGAVRAALANRMQRSVNICLGTALSTIGLTVPTVLIAAGYADIDLTLGLSGVNATLLLATLLVALMTFVSGAANILQGIVHLMLFVGYIIFVMFP